MALKRDWNVGTSMRCSESFRDLPSCANNPSIERTSSSSTLNPPPVPAPVPAPGRLATPAVEPPRNRAEAVSHFPGPGPSVPPAVPARSEEHTSELQSLTNLVCRLLLEK